MDGVTTALDGALGDWSMSSDAMRWKPDVAPVPTAEPCPMGSSGACMTLYRRNGDDVTPRCVGPCSFIGAT